MWDDMQGGMAGGIVVVGSLFVLLFAAIFFAITVRWEKPKAGTNGEGQPKESSCLSGCLVSLVLAVIATVIIQLVFRLLG